MISGYFFWVDFAFKSRSSKWLKFLPKATEIKLNPGYIPHIPPQTEPKGFLGRYLPENQNGRVPVVKPKMLCSRKLKDILNISILSNESLAREIVFHLISDSNQQSGKNIILGDIMLKASIITTITFHVWNLTFQCSGNEPPSLYLILFFEGTLGYFRAKNIFMYEQS